MFSVRGESAFFCSHLKVACCDWSRGFCSCLLVVLVDMTIVVCSPGVIVSPCFLGLSVDSGWIVERFCKKLAAFNNHLKM